MATPTETPGRVLGFGARRFLVRGADFTSEESLGIIRPRITDYPERVSLTPDFPLAGRRGGSRPARQVLAEGEIARAPAGLYPVERERDPKRINLSPLTPPLAAVGDSEFGPGDFIFRETEDVAAGTDSLNSTGFTFGPIIVTRVEYWSSITNPDLTVRAKILVAEANDIASYAGASGVPVTFGEINFVDFLPFSQKAVVTPFKVFDFQRLCFKFLWRNNDAAVQDFYASVSFRRLKL